MSTIGQNFFNMYTSFNSSRNNVLPGDTHGVARPLVCRENYVRARSPSNERKSTRDRPQAVPSWNFRPALEPMEALYQTLQQE